MMGFSWLDWWRFLGCLVMATLVLCLSAAVGTELMEWVKELARKRKSSCKQDTPEDESCLTICLKDSCRHNHGGKCALPLEKQKYKCLTFEEKTKEE